MASPPHDDGVVQRDDAEVDAAVLIGVARQPCSREVIDLKLRLRDADPVAQTRDRLLGAGRAILVVRILGGDTDRTIQIRAYGEVELLGKDAEDGVVRCAVEGDLRSRGASIDPPNARCHTPWFRTMPKFRSRS